MNPAITKPPPHTLRRFLAYFRHGLRVIWSVLLMQMVFLVLAAFVLTQVEPLEFGESLYFTFITALAVGYGDISPTSDIGRITCVLIGVVGLIYNGLLVGIAVYATGKAAKHGEDED
jgi:voltage-gated potassium channel